MYSHFSYILFWNEPNLIILLLPAKILRTCFMRTWMMQTMMKLQRSARTSTWPALAATSTSAVTPLGQAKPSMLRQWHKKTSPVISSTRLLWAITTRWASSTPLNTPPSKVRTGGFRRAERESPPFKYLASLHLSPPVPSSLCGQ